MCKSGDIVYFKNIVYEYGKNNVKHRLFVVVSTYNDSNGNIKLFCMPMTSHVKSFNKNPDKYVFISENFSNNNRKLCFVKLDSIIMKDAREAIKLNIQLSQENMNIIYNKIDNLSKTNKKYCFLNETIKNAQINEEQVKEKKLTNKDERN